MVGIVNATCITKACKQVIKYLPGKYKYAVFTSEMAELRKAENHTISSDYVVMEV